MDANELRDAVDLHRTFNDEGIFRTDPRVELPYRQYAAMKLLADAYLARLAADEANPLRTTAIEMVDVCLDPTSTNDEKSMAASTILEAVYPQMLAEHVELMQFRSRRIEADEAERSEREKPIDAPLGFVCENDSYRVEHRICGVGVTCANLTIKCKDWANVMLYSVCTNGRLLDLLAALNLNTKGE